MKKTGHLPSLLVQHLCFDRALRSKTRCHWKTSALSSHPTTWPRLKASQDLKSCGNFKITLWKKYLLCKIDTKMMFVLKPTRSYSRKINSKIPKKFQRLSFLGGFKENEDSKTTWNFSTDPNLQEAEPMRFFVKSAGPICQMLYQWLIHLLVKPWNCWKVTSSVGFCNMFWLKRPP